MAGGALQAVLQPGESLALQGDLVAQAAVGDLDAANRWASALVVVVQGTAELGLEALDVLGEGVDLLLEELAFGVEDESILRLLVGSVLNDLVDGVVVSEVLEVVLLAPAKPEAVNDLGRVR